MPRVDLQQGITGYGRCVVAERLGVPVSYVSFVSQQTEIIYVPDNTAKQEARKFDQAGVRVVTKTDTSCRQHVIMPLSQQTFSLMENFFHADCEYNPNRRIRAS